MILEVFPCAAQVNRYKHLFRIYENDKFGFIDSTGTIIIKPVFHSAGEFSEGLAAARINGTYGYIDQSGKFVISPQFELATKFKEGIAIVSNARKPFYINKNGERKFNCNYHDIGRFQNGRAKVKTESEKFGMIDTTGKLCIDTSYSELSNFVDGLAVVKGLKRYIETDTVKASPLQFVSTSYIYETGVIDSLGNMVIPFGKYSSITDMKDGYFNVNFISSPNDSSKKSKNNRRFIDRIGNLITSSEYQNIRNEREKRKLEKSKIITNKNTLYIDDEYIYFYEEEKDTINSYSKLIGIKKIDGTIIVSPIIQDIIGSGFNHGVLKCFVKNKLTYINTKGEILWRDSDGENKYQPLSDLNVGYMYEANFRIYSLPDIRGHIGGGFESNNSSKEISSSFNSRPNCINVEVRTEIRDTLNQALNGFRVYVTNTTNDIAIFQVIDSRLNMIVQAISPSGEWKDIEQLTNTSCIINNRNVILEPNHFWTFTTPKYEGDFKTKLRLKLRYDDPSDTTQKGMRTRRSNSNNSSKDSTLYLYDSKQKEISIYSNEYEGSVNPGQFWRKGNNYDDGIMDVSDE